MGEVLYVVMPAYNEEENIKVTVSEWYKVLEGKHELSRIVVADSGSNDNTHKILVDMKETFPKLEILENTLKQHGPKVIALYNYAIEKGADFIFQTDSDGQTNPQEFEGFWNERSEYDAIFGYRKQRGDGQGRMFVEKVLCLILKCIFGINVPDANAPFRLMKAKALKEYMNRFREDYSLPNIMVVTFFEHYKRNILFKEISFENRRAGENSINVRKIFAIGIKSIREFYKFKRNL